MRLLTLLLVILLGYLVNVACIGNKSYEKSRVELLYAQQKTKELTARNEMIRANILELKSGKSFESVENIARSRLGMIKPDEKFFRISVDNERTSTSNR